MVVAWDEYKKKLLYHRKHPTDNLTNATSKKDKMQQRLSHFRLPLLLEESDQLETQTKA